MKQKSKKFFLLGIIFIFLIFNNLVPAQSDEQVIPYQVNGKIIEYYGINLDEDFEKELVVTYRQIFDKLIHLAIFDYNGSAFTKIFDEQVEKKFLYFFEGNYDSNLYSNLMFQSTHEIMVLSLNSDGNKWIKYCDIDSLFQVEFQDSFPKMEIAHDFDRDGITDLLVPQNDSLIWYKSGKPAQKIPVEISAVYDFRLNVGGFNTIHTLMYSIPDCIYRDINKDGWDDLICIYKDRVISYLFNLGKGFEKYQTLDLTNFLTFRSGYSPINKHILLLDMDSDTNLDVILFNFSIGAILNTDKLGTMYLIFKGDKSGKWQEQPNKQVYFNEISGIESSFLFFDVNNDGLLDFIDIGSKFFSSSFIFSLTVKRSYLSTINVYLQSGDGNFIMNPIVNINKDLSLDSASTQDSSQVDFKTYSILDLSSFLNQIFGNFTYDFNKDKINDFLIYNFDGSYLLFLSDKNNPSVYPTKPSRILFISNELLNIFYLNGPYNLILNYFDSNLLIVFNKAKGKFYVKSVQ